MNGLSVIVATYNRPELLARVCDKLKDQREVQVEVILADDGSNPKPDVRCDRHLWRMDDGLFHKAWCVNQAVRLATFDCVAFLDDDTVPEKDVWAQTHLATLEDYEIARGPFAMALYDGDKLKSLSSTMYGTRRHYYAATNTSMRKSTFMRLGGYDERYDGHYGYEDIDLGLKIAEAEILVGYASMSAFATHLGESYCADGKGGLDASPTERNKELLYEKWGDRTETLEIVHGGGE
jgi:GT2 family glycosyltransferase